jgi:hypothetical protein
MTYIHRPRVPMRAEICEAFVGGYGMLVAGPEWLELITFKHT